MHNGLWTWFTWARRGVLVGPLLLAAAPTLSWAQLSPAPAAASTATVSAPAALPALPDLETPLPPTADDGFEAALGLVLSQGFSLSGTAHPGWGLTPAGYIRLGRWTASASSGFITREVHRQSEPQSAGGLSFRAFQRGDFGARLGLRLDRGRDESSNSAYTGLGDIDTTVRARAALAWAFAPHWSLGATASVDLLGQQGGTLGDVSLSRSWPWGPQGGWGTLSGGATLAWGNTRYMQTWYGVTSAQAAASGRYPAFQAEGGARDLGLNLTWRRDFRWEDQPWSSFASVGLNRLLGSAFHSPLSSGRDSLSFSTGVARRF